MRKTLAGSGRASAASYDEKKASLALVLLFLAAAVFGETPAKTTASQPRHALPEVRVLRGNIVVSRNGQDSQITTSGLDSDPVVSPDGSAIAFTRAIPRKTVETAGGEVDASQVWIANSDGSDARMLVGILEADKVEDMLAGFDNLRFSNDAKALYFTSSAWTTSNALKAVEIATGKVTHLAPSNGFEILRRGKYKGYFVSDEHKYGKNGAEDTCWLLSPQGKEIREVGDDLNKAVKRLEKP